MLQSLFNPDSAFFRFTGRVLDAVVLSVLFLMCCVPVVTIGPAASALYYSCVKYLRRGESGAYRGFFHAFRDNLRAGIPATLFFLLLGLALDALYLFLTMAAQAQGQVWPLVRVVYCVLLLLPLAYLAVTFPLLSRFTFTAGGLLSTALRLTLRHLPAALGTAVVLAASVVLTLRFLYWGAVLLTPAVCALVSSLLLEPVFRRYTPKGDGGDEGGYKPWYLR